ncbi:fused MFS/spermidine synthase [Brachybacterium sp. JHP9]|uniref:Fused MFS/spermidine synthase n=1 Tax=Brachybacterium equifaecis TaxID=2910770 RepID=A0ABT0QYG8_9MICO|nr:fused MFS/spermidine synthase [Brachybacterium equifaecis]MCL6422059.1 fused MFS/spermidine synthase [Brachybacterium equifaecis]
MTSRGRGRQRTAPFPRLGPVGEPIPISTGTAQLEVESDGSVLLLVNGVPSSHLDPDPAHLVFEYMRWMQLSIRLWLQEQPERAQALQVAHLGGAGCSLPRAVAAEWPRSRQIVIELDGILAESVREWFDLPRSPQLRVRTGDAAEALAQWREGRFDVLVRDVFAGSVTPPSLTGAEAARHAARVLAPGGLYLANSAAPPGTRILADEIATLSESFAHVEAIAEPAHLSGKRRGNCVILASQSPLPAQLDRALRSDPVSVRLAGGDRIRALRAAGRIASDS